MRRLLPLAAVLIAGLAMAAPAHAAPVHVRWTDLDDDPRVVDPQFSWDPMPGAARYEVEVNSSADWAAGSRVCCDEINLGTSLSPLKLLPNNTYYWRVRELDAKGNAGVWHVWCGNDVPECDAGGAPAGFEKTFDAVAPTVPGLRVRDSGADAPPAAGPLGVPATGAPVLAWDPVAGASSYEVKLAPWDALGGFCNWTSALGPAFVTATTAWTPLALTSAPSPVGTAHLGVTSGAPLQSGTTYCVRARARSDRDARGGEVVSDWTQIGGVGHPAFTYQAATLPPCHATSTPAGAYHDEPSATAATPRMPLFTWDRVDGACAYFIVIAKDAAFTKVLDVAFTTVPAYAPRLGSLPMTYPDETTTYYWAVMPAAAADGSGVSATPQDDNPHTFDKRSVPPTLLPPQGSAKGEPSFRWTAAEGARTYRVQVDDDPNFGTPLSDVVTASTSYTSREKYPAGTPLHWRVRANDELGVGLTWSEEGVYDVVPPETSIDSGPDLQGSAARFGFSSDEVDASFRCRLSGPGTAQGTWVAGCATPVTYPALADGTYTFSVAAADLAGNLDPIPATRTFKVDTHPPDTSLSAPSGPIPSSSVTAVFTASEAGSHFECRLDGPGGATGPWAACDSPARYDDLADGGYSLSVRATDAAGNTDPTPATTEFSVDTVAPDTVIGSGPAGTLVAPPSVTFAFTASEPGATFTCRLDGPGNEGQWAPCASPAAYAAPSPGDHRFLVRAADAAGNVDLTPATWAFAVAAPPKVPPPKVPPPKTPPPDVPPPEVLTDALHGGGLAAGGAGSHQLGKPTFLVPRRPVRARRGAVRLRFACEDAVGCTGRTFTLRGRGFKLRLKVRAAAPGKHVVATRLDRRARRALRFAPRRGLDVRLRATDGGPALRFRIVRAR